ncbi:transcriptional regulator with XRE-family HTH domain [Breznakia sp. PF5-3]|uniref:helix-turn-helix domain-containing protein n=1 Tax=unclassified Breznakia TaxID=2623764 RepID=UPI0024071925|nr:MULTISPECIES: helix-turn-helix transcriptional regulator [unclassified Breznakia]MDF9824684.1 transcriptional regulator with XRE-family HTH domain [Breznakia sp. PM6-1]MDF9835347.1 transcriptional regulator with XRE-family HTH domain [Breznakia sp. PF5-3]MDF9836946.1 transcriptional regulator with XRE-family HTH domain [Breznakia sp. PFB2-8]MDF9859582.1 transcriptional regulator with XRE-family HTH domain [Breznakia sp. PH5-24]
MEKNARDIFVKNLKRIMEKKKISQTIIAREMDLPLSTISSWVNAQSYPRVDRMSKLANILNVSMNELTGDSDQRFSTAEDAMKFLVEQPMIAAYGGYDIDKMSDEEIVKFANTVLDLLKVAAKQIT